MTVRYQLEGDVALLTLDRPDVFNAIDGELARRLVDSLRRAGREARAAVLTGAGKAFCSGADLADLMGDYQRGGPDLAKVIAERFNPAIKALVETPIPTVAALNGAAAGAGMGLALGCDLRVMSSQAFLMSAFINVALIPDSGTSWFLAQMVGLSRAMELAMTGRRVIAEEALALGLAHRVVEPDQVVAVAVQWAAQLADGPSHAYPATRALLRQGVVTSLEQALAAEQEAQGELGRHPAHLEGVAAFIEKRKPNFR